MSLKTVGASIFLAAVIIIPGISVAQSTAWWCSPQFASWWGSVSCDANYGGGGLVVYVFIPGQQNVYGPTVVPADFTVSVSGNAPTPSTFRGSNPGTPVLLAPGAYNVTLSGDLHNHTPTYSQGCSGTISSGQNALCTITVSPTNRFYSQPVPYPYSYNRTPITCSPTYQTVTAGQTARFEAFGGLGSYTWTTAERTYLNVGPVLSVALQHTGTQTVIVQSSTGNASCTVNVVSGSGAIVYPSTTQNVPLITYTYPTMQAGPSISYNAGTSYTATYVPTLPNTGFGPVSPAAVAFAVVGLVGFALVAAPYVRKTLIASGF